MRISSIFILVSIFFLGCSSTEKVAPVAEQPKDTLQTKITPPAKQAVYQSTPPLKWDLIHTALKVSFRYEWEQLYGEAQLTLSPHFYKQNRLQLDAKAFNVKKVTLLNDSTRNIKYTYAANKITIDFDTFIHRTDTLVLSIDYVANPNQVELNQGKAIRSGKGLYFINPKGLDRFKPIQIWTQGETDFSSCWYPTLDEPNQKTTQEIEITVPQHFTTLSNGVLEFSTENGNGTRTDYWHQDLPHSPYLFMMAIGEFSVYRDEWREKEVSYYTEAKYAADAPYIFGDTKEMLTYYSDLLGVEYPWDKYAQVVVRDFVSGAMENTSATLHGEFVQRTRRELIDYPQHGIIAHELFHQWFGDLVSCENWSNLPLNEAFATYGEYLWDEYKYGADVAALTLSQKLGSYLNESKRKTVDWVRFDYVNKDDMFDAHSYSKGACILHQLRTVIGDEAFFESLKTYLTRHAHSSAEMHHLRLIAEEITGQDLNWFFNQWAYDDGHPVLEISNYWDTTRSEQVLIVKQKQNLGEHPLYQLPVTIAVHELDTFRLYDIQIENEVDSFRFSSDYPPVWVDFDHNKYLLAEVQFIDRTPDQCFMQFARGKSYQNRRDALQRLVRFYPKHDMTQSVMDKALNDPFYAIRLKAIRSLKLYNLGTTDRFKSRLLYLSKNDPKSTVRAMALNTYRKLYPNVPGDFYTAAQTDSSYFVIQMALETALEFKDTAAVVALAKANETTDNKELLLAICNVYGQLGMEEKAPFFALANHKTNGYDKIKFIRAYATLLKHAENPVIIVKGVNTLMSIVESQDYIWTKVTGIKAMKKLHQSLSDEKQSLAEQIKQLENDGKDTTGAQAKLEAADLKVDAFTGAFIQLKASQKHPQIQELLSDF